MNRSSNRLFTASAGLAACGLILTGCSSGQITQTADQESAVNGAAGGVKHIDLRNVHVQAVQSSDYLQPGRIVALNFVAVNTSTDVDDELVGISSDIGEVAMSGDTAIPAGASLLVGSPDGQAEFTPMSSAEPTEAAVLLMQPITNGLTYDFTFDFDKAGQTTLAVPISAGNAPRQEVAAD